MLVYGKKEKKKKSPCYPTRISLLKVEKCTEKWAPGTQYPADVTDVPLKTRGHSNKPDGEKRVHHWWVSPVKFFRVIKQACFKSLKLFFSFLLHKDKVPLNLFLLTKFATLCLRLLCPPDLSCSLLVLLSGLTWDHQEEKELKTSRFSVSFLPCHPSVPGFTYPRVQFGWQSWQTLFPSAYFQTRVSFSPRTPAGQDFTQWGPSIKWAHFMQLSGPCREKQLVCNALTSPYSGGNSEDKSKCLLLLEVFSIICFYYLAT